MQPPDTRYAVRPDGISIAYQVLGEGAVDLVFCFGWISHLDLQWTNPEMTRFFTRLASFTRLVLFDKAGTGLSDPLPHVATLEERVEDIRAVMDAAGVERAALFGESEGGPSSMLFAATHPERTSAVIVYGTAAAGRISSDARERFGLGPERLAEPYARLTEAVDRWGSGLTLAVLAPTADAPLTRRFAGTYERASVSPGMARGLLDSLAGIDVLPVARTITGADAHPPPARRGPPRRARADARRRDPARRVRRARGARPRLLRRR